MKRKSKEAGLTKRVLHLTPTWAGVGGGGAGGGLVPRNQLGILQINSILTQSTRRQLLIPQVWGFNPTRPASKLPLQTLVTSPGVSDWPVTDLRYQQLLLRFNEFARAAHRTETFYLLGNQVINIKEEEFNSQMKKSTGSFHTVSRLIALLASPRVHQPGSSPDPVLLRVLWGLHYIGMVD